MADRKEWLGALEVAVRYEVPRRSAFARARGTRPLERALGVPRPDGQFLLP